MADTVWSPYYLSGQEGYMAFAAGAMVTPETQAAPGSYAGVPALIGYTNVPGFTMNENTAPVRGAGSPRPLVFLNQRREFTIDNTLILSAGAATKQFLKFALRGTSNGDIAAEYRHQCLGVLDIMGGALGACDENRDNPWLGLHGMFNTLNITIGENQPPTAQFQIWPITVSSALGYELPDITDVALVTAGGVPFGFQHLSFVLGSSPYSTDYSANIQSVSIAVNNNLRRKGTRPPSDDDYNRCVRQIQVGAEDITVTLNLHAPIPQTGSLGQLNAVLTDGTDTLTISLTTNQLSQQAQNSTAPEAEFSYSGTIMSSGISIS